MAAGADHIGDGRRSASALAAGWRPTPFWRVQLVGWTLYSIADLAARQSIYRDLSATLTLTLTMAPVLMLVTGGLRYAYDRLALERRGLLRAGLWIVGLSLPCALLVVAASSLVRQLFGWSIPHWDTLETWAVLATNNATVIGGWSLAYAWVRADQARRRSAEQAARAEAGALRAELGRLRLQLDPHFLFNALNGIATEIEEDPPAALAMLRALSDYLRHSLDSRDKAVVPLAGEVAALTAYLAVQRARFGAALRTTLEVAPGAGDRPIASFLLQPLVENAIKHGSRGADRRVEVTVRAAGDTLTVLVRNPGRLASHTAAPERRQRPAGGGVGLANLRQRLALHYPGRHRFSLGEEQGLVTAELVLVGEPCSGS